MFASVNNPGTEEAVTLVEDLTQILEEEGKNYRAEWGGILGEDNQHIREQLIKEIGRTKVKQVSENRF